MTCDIRPLETIAARIRNSEFASFSVAVESRRAVLFVRDHESLVQPAVGFYPLDGFAFIYLIQRAHRMWKVDLAAAHIATDRDQKLVVGVDATEHLFEFIILSVGKKALFFYTIVEEVRCFGQDVDEHFGGRFDLTIDNLL